MDSAAVNRCILDCAKIEFASSGYHRTVVSDIADRAGVGKGTIYRRFGDKKGLFTAMLRQGIKDLEAGLRAALDDTASPEQNLETIINVFFDLSVHSHDLMEVIITEGTQLMGFEQGELKGELDGVLGVIEGVLQQGCEQGCFRMQETAKMAFLLHRFLVSVLEGAVIFGYRPKEAFGALLRDIVFNGIRTQQSKEISS
mgnify:CR=1 FL=1